MTIPIICDTIIYDEDGTKLVSYTYDAWGNCTVSYPNNGSSSTAIYNPFRYRGYYLDTETGFYYLNSRYYDPAIGRWLNADAQISGIGGDLRGYNLFAYCFNNPINMSDPSGNWPKWIETVTNWTNNNIIQPLNSFFSELTNAIVTVLSSHDENYRPYTGEPGSIYIAPNGDSRTYGPDGNPEHDYDHDDHGRPDKHPHDSNGGHNHDWKNGVRGPAYSEVFKPIAGVALVTASAIGIVIVAVDDVTGIGVGNDFLFGPLGSGIGEGLILIFG